MKTCQTCKDEKVNYADEPCISCAAGGAADFSNWKPKEEKQDALVSEAILEYLSEVSWLSFSCTRIKNNPKQWEFVIRTIGEIKDE